MRRIAAPLVGSALLVALAIVELPWKQGLFHVPRTPFDRSKTRSAVPWYILLEDAAPWIPEGASVAARHEPTDPYRDTYFYYYAIALLPGRRILPAALWGGPVDPAIWGAAEYFVIAGPRPAAPPGVLLLETPAGTVWRRAKP